MNYSGSKGNHYYENCEKEKGASSDLYDSIYERYLELDVKNTILAIFCLIKSFSIQSFSGKFKCIF